jgi:hypothetical protein
MSADEFFSRWSNRKAHQAAEAPGAKCAEFESGDEPTVPTNTINSNNEIAKVNCPQSSVSSGEYNSLPAPSIDDAQAMTPQSDFTRYMKGDVDSNVKNTALKKLWTDPRFNVQDGLDVYIDDYSKPDPMPAGMLEKLAHMSFLTLFDPKPEDEKLPAETHALSPHPSPANAGEGVTTEITTELPHENADLQLQPNDAAGRESDQHGIG